MARDDKERVSMGAIVHGLLTRREACPHCGSHDIRRSDRPPSRVMHLLGLRPFRCEYCWRLFALRAAVLGGTGEPRGLVKG